MAWGGMLLGTVEKAKRIGDEGLGRIELAGPHQSGPELRVGIGVIDDHIGIGIVGDDLAGLGIEGRLGRVEDHRSLNLAALGFPGLGEALRQAFAIGLVAIDDGDKLALGGAELVGDRRGQGQSLEAVRRHGAEDGAFILDGAQPHAGADRPDGDPLADGEAIGDGDGFRRDGRPDQAGGALVDQAAGGREGGLGIALDIGADILGRDRHARLDGLLIGIGDGDLDRLVLGGARLGQRAGHFQKLADGEVDRIGLGGHGHGQ